MPDPVHSSMGNIIEVADPVTPGMPGQRNQATLNEAFPRSPIYDPAGNAGVEEKFTKLVMEGAVKDIVDGQPAPVPGFGFSTFNRDFVDAPDLSEENTELTDNAGNEIVGSNDQQFEIETVLPEVSTITLSSDPLTGQSVDDR